MLNYRVFRIINSSPVKDKWNNLDMNNYCNFFRISFLIIIRFTLAVLSFDCRFKVWMEMNIERIIIIWTIVEQWSGWTLLKIEKMEKCVHNFLDEVVAQNQHTKLKEGENVDWW